MEPDYEFLCSWLNPMYLPGGERYASYLPYLELAVSILRYGDVQMGYVSSIGKEIVHMCLPSEDLVEPITLTAGRGDGTYQLLERSGVLSIGVGSPMAFACVYGRSKRDEDVAEGSAFSSITALWPMSMTNDSSVYARHLNAFSDELISSLYDVGDRYYGRARRGEIPARHRLIHPFKIMNVLEVPGGWG